MARNPKGSRNGTRKQNSRLSRRALLSSLGTGLALASLGSGKKALAITPTPTPTNDICALGRDHTGANAIQTLDFKKYQRVGIDMNKGFFGITSSDKTVWLLNCDLKGFEKITFYLKANQVQAWCGTNP
jgi:hypothetical protein